MKDGSQNLILKVTGPEPNTSGITHILQMLSLQFWSPYCKDTQNHIFIFRMVKLQYPESMHCIDLPAPPFCPSVPTPVRL
jgi:hypothetical protein